MDTFFNIRKIDRFLSIREKHLEETHHKTKIDYFGGMDEKAGFEVGEKVTVSVSQNRLIITRLDFMKIHRYNPEKPKKATVFYIQSHGLHAGRPLKNQFPTVGKWTPRIKRFRNLFYGLQF